jgi:hypothetical protein
MLTYMPILQRQGEEAILILSRMLIDLIHFSLIQFNSMPPSVANVPCSSNLISRNLRNLSESGTQCQTLLCNGQNTKRTASLRLRVPFLLREQGSEIISLLAL